MKIKESSIRIFHAKLKELSEIYRNISAGKIIHKGDNHVQKA